MGWQQRDTCTGSPTMTFQNMDSSCSTSSACLSGAEVRLCTVQGGGHSWPGGDASLGTGYTTPYLSATDAMWDFFQKHPLP